MCGVPVHAADDYLQKLIALGHRVAVCEQTEDPAEARRRGSKIGRAARGDPPRHARHDHRRPAARSRIATTIWRRSCGSRQATAPTGTRSRGSTSRPASSACSECGAGGLAAALCRASSRARCWSSTGWRRTPEIRSLVERLGAALTPLPAAFFDVRPRRGAARRSSSASKRWNRSAISAGRSFPPRRRSSPMSTRRRSPSARRSSRRGGSATATRCGSTRRRAPISSSSDRHRAARAGTLLAAIDRTRSAARIAAPRRAAGEPACRPGADRGAARCRAVFRRAAGASGGDPRRARRRAGHAARAVAARARPRRAARPRHDPRRARGGRRQYPQKLQNPECGEIQELSDRLAPGPGVRLDHVPGLTSLRCCGRRLSDDLPLLKRDGGFVRARLRRRRSTRRAGSATKAEGSIAGLQARYAERDRHPLAQNPAQQRSRLLRRGDRRPGAGAASANGEAEKFIHRQTMASAMRFTTTELAELEQRIASAADRALSHRAFDLRRARPRRSRQRRTRSARRRARSPRSTSRRRSPSLRQAKTMCGRRSIEASRSAIEGGRHPVVEQALRAEGQSFVANDCDLGPIGSPSPPRGRGWPRAAGEGELRLVEAASSIPPHPALRGHPLPKGRGGRARPAASGF